MDIVHQRSALSVIVLFSLGLTLGACGGDEESATPDPTSANPTDEVPEPEPEGPAGPSVEEDSFTLIAEPSGPYSAGEEGTFTIRLTPHGEFHVNQLFQMTVALSGPEGVELPSDALSNDDAAEYTEQVARFEVPFTANAAGEPEVRAEIDFAVCTPRSCIPDHRTLALALPVQ